jgi:OOP family OmpA-OmpF porin
MRTHIQSVFLAGLLALTPAVPALAADMVDVDQILQQLEKAPPPAGSGSGSRGIRINPSGGTPVPQQAAPAPAQAPASTATPMAAHPAPAPQASQQAAPPTREYAKSASAQPAERPSVTVYLYFRSGSADLADDFSRRQLAALCKALSSPALASARFEIGGYTDAVGSDALNQTLSARRAEHIRSVLLSSYGLAPERVVAKGYGKSNPVASNDTEDGRAKNRRVVIKRLD